MLYASICWTTCPNLMVKSRIDPSSRLKMVCSELMFPFFRIEHKYWETNAAHNSLNELIDPLGSFWNQARGGSFQASQEHFSQKMVIPRAHNHRLVKVQHVVVRVRRAIIHGKRRYDKAREAHNSRCTDIVGTTTCPYALR